MALQAAISREITRRYLHARLDVLLESPVRGRCDAWTGRARFQAPEVDGVVRVRDRRPNPGSLPAVAKVEIVSTGVYDLRGNLVA